MSDEGVKKAAPVLEADPEDLYENAPCAHLSTLPDGTIVRGNKTFFEWLGADRAEILNGVRFQSLLTVGSRIYYETHYSPLLQMQGYVNEIALEMRRKDGTVRPIVASARRLQGPDGAALVHRVALFDSTDRRRYEHELLEARKRAEQATRDLETIVRQKTEFSAILAHELRNPLAPIRNALELMRRSGHDEGIIEKASATMRRQVAQLGRLVEDLFEVSRVDQGKLSLRRVPIDLVSLLHHAAEASLPGLDAAGVSYTATLPTVPIYIAADAARLGQVIGNILNNASKFTLRGGSVALVLEQVGNEAVLHIRDTGIGIATDDLPRVFDLFMQAETPLESRAGLGIGLTLAKSLIERHDGRISVHSDGVGHGTEFIVSVPLLTEMPVSVSKSLPFAAGPEVETPPRRVLVVDDNNESAEMLGMLLTLAGHEVRLAHDGMAAVETSASFQPHVVLLDIGLPILNGYDAARRIRIQAGMQPLLVALTGWGQESDRRKAAEAGFDAHLLKPVDHDELTTLIGSVSESGRD
jgi:PAS domain S-box-containing protein